jgi:histidine ammonia-lyase
MEAATDFARPAVLAEVNGSSDNPLVLGDELVSTGLFQPSTLALALDTVALALHQVAALSAARTAALLQPGLSGLPANLSPFGAERSGFATVVKTTQALLARLRRLAAPAYDDPRPGAAGVEDNSANAPVGAERLAAMVDLVRLVVAAEALVAAQAVDLARPEVLGSAPAALHAAIRAVVPGLDDDRACGPDIEAVARLLPADGAADLVG